MVHTSKQTLPKSGKRVSLQGPRHNLVKGSVQPEKKPRKSRPHKSGTSIKAWIMTEPTGPFCPRNEVIEWKVVTDSAWKRSNVS